MQKVFLAYANSRDQPLPTLQEEEEQVYRMLARREAERHFSLHRDTYTSIPKIAEYLALYQEDILVFHYSGHAEPGMLLLADEAANAAGIECKYARAAVGNGGRQAAGCNDGHGESAARRRDGKGADDAAAHADAMHAAE